jgi:hypothetical protein
MFFAVDTGERKETTISLKEFFDNLYVPFSQENERDIKRAVKEACGFVIVVGPVGGGKSTIIYNALQEYNSGEGVYFLFDFKKEIEEFYAMGNKPDERMRFIRDVLKKKLAKEFLCDLNLKTKFVLTALRMFFEEERLQNLILRYMAKYGDPNIAKNKEYQDTLFYSDPYTIAEEELFVKKSLTCAQMISAIKATLGKKKFLIILDNVDRLTIGAQQYLFSAAIDIYHGGNGDFGTIVAVRDKTIMRYEEAGSNGDVVEVVSLTSYAKEKTKPIRLDPPTAEFVSNLLEKRHIFACSLVVSKEVESEIGISKRLFEKMRFLVKNRFVEERFYNLANYNCRYMLLLNWQFIRYLFRLAAENVIVNKQGELVLDEPSMNSYLYRWVCATHNPQHRFVLDTVRKYSQYLNRIFSNAIECDIEAIILAWLANKSQKSRRFLRVNDLLDSFRGIGVDDKTVLSSLYNLYDVDLSYRYVEVGDSEERYGFDRLCTDNLRVTITPLGAEFVGFIMTKFEFLHQCLVYPDIVSVEAQEMLEPASVNMDTKVNKILEFLKIMKEVHGNALLKIKDASSRSHPSWEEYYREQFCVKEQLILERIIRSHLSHLRQTHPVSYSKWKAEYVKLLEDYHESFGSSHKAAEILASVI